METAHTGFSRRFHNLIIRQLKLEHNCDQNGRAVNLTEWHYSSYCLQAFTFIPGKVFKENSHCSWLNGMLKAGGQKMYLKQEEEREMSTTESYISFFFFFFTISLTYSISKTIPKLCPPFIPDLWRSNLWECPGIAENRLWKTSSQLQSIVYTVIPVLFEVTIVQSGPHVMKSLWGGTEFTSFSQHTI